MSSSWALTFSITDSSSGNAVSFFIRAHSGMLSVAAMRAVYLAEKTMTSFERLLF
jgi:hypothetical protein